MSFLSRLLSPVTDMRAANDPLDDRFYGDGGGQLALTGVPVTPETALNFSAVWACVRVLSDPLSWLPLPVFQRQSNGDRQRADWHPLYDTLMYQPNRWQTAREWKKQMMVYALMRGNGISRKVPGPRGAADQLIPIHPDRLIGIGQFSDYSLFYDIRKPGGQGTERLLQDEVFHLRGFTLDGLTGVSVIKFARETIGLGLGMEGYAARFFSQNAVPAAVLSHPGALSANARRRMRDEWEADTSGLTNAHRAVVVTEGTVVTPISWNHEDSQFLQSRVFGIEEMGRWFGVPLHKIQSTSKETTWGTGIEEMNLEFIAEALMPWAVSWEQAVRRDLIVDMRNYYAEFLFEALLRGKLLERYQAYHLAVTDGWMVRSEPRQKENMNRIDGLDQPLRPANTLPGDQAPPAGGAVSQIDAEHELGPWVSSQIDGQTEGHYQRLLREAAGRVVRKERAALEKAFERASGHPDPWSQAVSEFLSGHAAYVAQTLCVKSEAAEQYVLQFREKLLVSGAGWASLEAVIDRGGERLASLVTLAVQGLNGGSNEL